MPTFTPPTIPVSVGDASRYGMWSRYAIEVGQSVVRIGGILVLHPYPSSDELRPLAEGVDFFLGGRTYEVSALTAAELTAAGFTIGALIALS